MKPEDVLAIARQGHPKVIEAIINHTTKPHGISVRVARRQRALYILIEGEAAIQQAAVVTFVEASLYKLQLQTITSAVVYGRQRGQASINWSEKLVIDPPIAPSPLSIRPFNPERSPVLPQHPPLASDPSPPQARAADVAKKTTADSPVEDKTLKRSEDDVTINPQPVTRNHHSDASPIFPLASHPLTVNPTEPDSTSHSSAFSPLDADLLASTDLSPMIIVMPEDRSPLYDDWAGIDDAELEKIEAEVAQATHPATHPKTQLHAPPMRPQHANAAGHRSHQTPHHPLPIESIASKTLTLEHEHVIPSEVGQAKQSVSGWGNLEQENRPVMNSQVVNSQGSSTQDINSQDINSQGLKNQQQPASLDSQTSVAPTLSDTADADDSSPDSITDKFNALVNQNKALNDETTMSSNGPGNNASSAIDTAIPERGAPEHMPEISTPEVSLSDTSTVEITPPERPDAEMSTAEVTRPEVSQSEVGVAAAIASTPTIAPASAAESATVELQALETPTSETPTPAPQPPDPARRKNSASAPDLDAVDLDAFIGYPEALILILFTITFFIWQTYIALLDSAAPEGTLSASKLAQRLGVSRSTISRRKTRPDFPEWSQATDPDGIKWQYQEGVFIPTMGDIN